MTTDREMRRSLVFSSYLRFLLAITPSINIKFFTQFDADQSDPIRSDHIRSNRIRSDRLVSIKLTATMVRMKQQQQHVLL